MHARASYGVWPELQTHPPHFPQHTDTRYVTFIFQRSKYICIPRNVREAGNHFIWDFQEGFSLNVPTSVGFLHHYRVCEFGGDDCVQTESVVDRTVADRYKEDLISAMDRVLRDTTASGCISKGETRTSFT